MPPDADSSLSSDGSIPSAGAKYVYYQPKWYKLNSYQVKDVLSGATAFMITSNAFSIGDGKKLLDSSGNPVCKMSKSQSIFSFRPWMQIQEIVDSRSNKVVLTLRKKGFFPMLFGFGTEMVQVWRGGEEIGEPWLQVKGKVENRSFSFISSTERVVATVSRKGINMTDVYAEKDTCVLRVEPGVDATLMVFLAVALFQKHRDYDNGTGLKSFLRGFV